MSPAAARGNPFSVDPARIKGLSDMAVINFDDGRTLSRTVDEKRQHRACRQSEGPTIADQPGDRPPSE
jgi:hypothetical protein